MVSRSGSANITDMNSFFSWPTPCSPVMEPPTRTQRREDVAGKLLGAFFLAFDGAIVENERVEIAVAGVEDVGDAQSGFGAEALDLGHDFGKLRCAE